MRPTTYVFDKKKGKFDNGVGFTVADYFQYYTTGIEDIFDDDNLYITERYNNERAEVVSYLLMGSENLSDTLLAMNNDVYLWDTPYDNDMFEAIVEKTYEYTKRIYKTQMTYREQERFLEASREIVTEDDDILRKIIVPKEAYISRIQRQVKDYIKDRKVE